MKKITTLLCLIAMLSCKAQQNIVPLIGGEEYEDTADYYLKDTNKYFDKFLGTWVWQSGNNSLTFVLKKETKHQTTENELYEDLLIGEYKYIENGVVKANTLPNFDIPKVKGYGHRISGNLILEKNSRPPCDSCSVNERRIKVRISHPTKHFAGAWLALRHITVNGVQKIEALIYYGFEEFPIPLAKYTLTKQ